MTKIEIEVYSTGDLLASSVRAHLRTSTPSAVLSRVVQGFAAFAQLDAPCEEDRGLSVTVERLIETLRVEVLKRETEMYDGGA